MKIKCSVCELGKMVNEFHSAAVHTHKYHQLLIKIHEKIESYEKDGRLLTMQPLELIIQELKSLLESEK